MELIKMNIEARQLPNLKPIVANHLGVAIAISTSNVHRKLIEPDVNVGNGGTSAGDRQRQPINIIVTTHGIGGWILTSTKSG